MKSEKKPITLKKGKAAYKKTDPIEKYSNPTSSTNSESDPQSEREESEFPSKKDPVNVPDKNQNLEDIKNIDPDRSERTF
ncbi:hypothetical protein C3K47_06010 [Solitalea longa]|uniref:Uncharacterized protein n=1 Tax=Solitalea longa TaxID=2079460 RepID=A0A2S5A413_9SPHI|nr:hypothetical protein [Solitalea longa]POY37318.1 hypothetical protein C3K47_06010 [Solitalea longa]